MQNGFYEVRLPDATDYWTEMVKCRHACPVHTDACGYVTAIAEGKFEKAYRIARAHNPFASICGRVCGAPCERDCRRGDVDAPVTIRPLKRFVSDIARQMYSSIRRSLKASVWCCSKLWPAGFRRSPLRPRPDRTS